jgi:hypothetical protein
MIVFTEGTGPAIRIGELDLGGRRVAARALPYAGEAAPPPYRFDVFERRFVALRTEGVVTAGPCEPGAWREALAAAPAGPVAIGPCSAAEPIYRAYLAAAEGALGAGRGAYLIDPEPEGLPEGAGAAAVVVVCWRPGALAPALAAAASRGLAAGLALPAIPGWTAEESFLEPLLSDARRAGASFVCAMPPSWDGVSRRLAVEARATEDPRAAEALFERLHHAGSGGGVEAAMAAVRGMCAEEGFAAMPPRPRGRGEPEVNARGAARLEERASQAGAGEHRSAMLHAAVRWIDEAGRDLAPVLADGNLKKVLPFDASLAAEVVAAVSGNP